MQVRQTVRRHWLAWALALVLVPLFTWQAFSLISDFSHRIHRDYHWDGPPKLPNDFPMFYAGAQVLTSGEHTSAYQRSVMVEAIGRVQGYETPSRIEQEWFGDWMRYYNPPGFLIAISPLTLLDLHTAYLVAFGLNLVVVAAFLAAIAYLCRHTPALALVLGVALVGFTPLYFALSNGQPTIAITLFLALALLAAEAGRRNLAAVLFALVGAKPQFLILPGLALVRRWPVMAVPLAIAGLLIVLLPFAWIGAGGVLDYARIVLDRGSTDMSREEFSRALVNWTGFFQAATGGVPTTLVMLASAGTLLAFALVLRHGDIRLTFAAALLTTLLVVPHVHVQDWLVAIVAAAAVLSRPSNRPFTAGAALGFLGVYAGANTWEAAHAATSDGTPTLYLSVPSAFFLILWFAAAPLLESTTAPSTVPRTHRTVPAA